MFLFRIEEEKILTLLTFLLFLSVPLFRYWNMETLDHFYSTDIQDVGIHGNRGKNSYISEGVECQIYKVHVPGTIPLYRYVLPGPQEDHLYTTDENEIGTTEPGQVGKYGYKMEEIAGYCYANPTAGTVPLYVYHKASTVDHLYTTHGDELGENTPFIYQKKGYDYEGIACHVYPD